MILVASATSFAHAREYMLAPGLSRNIGIAERGCRRSAADTRNRRDWNNARAGRRVRSPIMSWVTAIPLACTGHLDGKRTSQSSARKKFAEACRLRFLDREGSRSYGASGRVMNGAHRSLTSGVRPPAATQSRRNSKDFLGFRSCVLRST